MGLEGFIVNKKHGFAYYIAVKWRAFNLCISPPKGQIPSEKTVSSNTTKGGIPQDPELESYLHEGLHRISDHSDRAPYEFDQNRFWVDKSGNKREG